MRNTNLAPGQLFHSVHMEKSYLGKAGYPLLYNDDLLLEVAPGQIKTHVNNYSSKIYFKLVNTYKTSCKINYKISREKGIIKQGRNGSH